MSRHGFILVIHYTTLFLASNFEIRFTNDQANQTSSPPSARYLYEVVISYPGSGGCLLPYTGIVGTLRGKDPAFEATEFHKSPIFEAVWFYKTSPPF